MLLTHDYCSVPEPAALDVALSKNEELSKEIEELKTKLEEMTVKQRFGFQRFATSDEDVRFYMRFASYRHLMAFWRLIEPSTAKIMRTIDEFFLFMMYLALGLKDKDLGHRFNIHRSTIAMAISAMEQGLLRMRLLKAWRSITPKARQTPSSDGVSHVLSGPEMVEDILPPPHECPRMLLYAFQPIPLLPAFLKKVQLEKATVLLVVPR
ncbi:UNVERIFIED_CONTAM: hypothetical protein FKN15_045392 [Acipenser sinensis]